MLRLLVTALVALSAGGYALHELKRKKQEIQGHALDIEEDVEEVQHGGLEIDCHEVEIDDDLLDDDDVVAAPDLRGRDVLSPELRPGLWICSPDLVQNRSFLRRFGISRILCVSGLENLPVPYPVDCLRLLARSDSCIEAVVGSLYTALMYIIDALRNGERVLITCHSLNLRLSAAVAVAFRMHVHGTSPHNAYQLLANWEGMPTPDIDDMPALTAWRLARLSEMEED